MWECKHHDEARHATLDQLKPQDRPPTLKDWLNPVGETARRNIILGSVLTYLEKTGLGDDIQLDSTPTAPTPCPLWPYLSVTASCIFAQ
ncbi:hypothetical protein HPB47_011526 [Ixodes persulcatus]|uniref:Uncharacterized protein n=1 Tax=Ixodes persulcatus TaxID=34615 RepID=A0AC60NWW1_IXOPE|nr:hypothetical protein HPB47_011526 [Ixodes persulcatus]